MRWAWAAAIVVLAVGFAMLVPERQSCPPDRKLTTTGWNEAEPRCYEEPIAQLEPGTPPLEQSRLAVQLAIVGAGAILALIVIILGRATSRSATGRLLARTPNGIPKSSP